MPEQVKRPNPWRKMMMMMMMGTRGCSLVVKKKNARFVWDTFSGMTNQNNPPFQNGTWRNLQIHIHNKHQLFQSLINLNLSLRRTETKHCAYNTEAGTAVLIISFGLAYRQKLNRLKLGYVM